MRILTTTILAGCAALGFAGLYEQAKAKSAPALAAHALTVQLPDGQVEQISYRGDVAPAIAISPSGAPFAAFLSGDPAADALFGNFDQIAAQMDQEMAQMMRQAQVMAAQPLVGFGAVPDQLTQVTFGQLPAGASSYVMVSTLSPKGACTRTMQITAPQHGGVSHVVSQSSGDCKGVPALSVSAPDSLTVESDSAAKADSF